MIEFLGNIFISILVAYLSFTNSLAEYIESFLPDQQEITIVSSSDHDAPEDIFDRIASLPTFSKDGIPKILLDHKGFQQAALIASRNEDRVLEDESIPLRDAVEDALVNIYCQYKTPEYIRTTTGTGFFINQKGVILTNAHVAQFLLLEDLSKGVHDTECVIRLGDPATPQYKAELLYISPVWVFENADLITDETPRGTGERDYALLYISKSIDEKPLPVHFPAIQVDTALLSRNTEGKSVMTAGYPAGNLLRNGADAKLAPVVASTTVDILYTFGSNYADIFSISDSPVGEQGASGGPIVAPDTRDVIGLIVTRGDENLEGKRSLRALTLSYIDRTIQEETGFSLVQNMQGDVALRGGVFKSAMVPFLAGILEEELTR